MNKRGEGERRSPGFIKDPPIEIRKSLSKRVSFPISSIRFRLLETHPRRGEIPEGLEGKKIPQRGRPPGESGKQSPETEIGIYCIAKVMISPDFPRPPPDFLSLPFSLRF